MMVLAGEQNCLKLGSDVRLLSKILGAPNADAVMAEAEGRSSDLS